MSKRLTYITKPPAHLITQIGKEDDDPTPFWAIRRDTRARLVRQRPDLCAQEIERRVDRIVRRGMRH